MTVLVDASAWIEYLRNAGSTQDQRVRQLLETSDVATTDPILLEVVGGGRSAFVAERLSRLLGRARYIPQTPHEDALSAADIYVRCRARGETVRALNDCLIAAIAIRSGVPVLHNDRDFDVIARYVGLEAVRA